MTTNYFISPHSLLQPFIHHYILSTSHGEKITFNSAWPASTETSLIFHLADQPLHYAGDNMPSALQNDMGCVAGLQSGYNGTVHFNGVYHRFIIQFRANGYSKLFRIPAKLLVNKLQCVDEVFGNAAKALNEKLRNAADIPEMTGYADQFLSAFLTRQPKEMQVHDGISFVANELVTNSNLLSVEDYARKANMSVRNFSRRFFEQVGISPKFYCRLLRFNNAVTTKIKKSSRKWTSIAYECGYYDQMHMIRDFKQFAGVNPSDLFDNTGKFSRPRIDVTGSTDQFFNDLNSKLDNEMFIKLSRAGF